MCHERMIVYDGEREDVYSLDEWDWEIVNDRALILMRKNGEGGVIYVGYRGFRIDNY